MSLVDDPRPPLPEWVMDAYTTLSSHTPDSDVSRQDHIPTISREQAVDVLYRSDELALESADAEYAITRLIERGYLYEVDTELRVTIPVEER